jgi:hypothetical protein
VALSVNRVYARSDTLLLANRKLAKKARS